MPAFRTGQRVTYKPVGGKCQLTPGQTPHHLRFISNLLVSSGRESHTSESVGIIREVSTSNTTMTGRQVEATPEEPRYEVRSPTTKKQSWYFLII